MMRGQDGRHRQKRLAASRNNLLIRLLIPRLSTLDFGSVAGYDPHRASTNGILEVVYDQERRDPILEHLSSPPGPAPPLAMFFGGRKTGWIERRPNPRGGEIVQPAASATGGLRSEVRGLRAEVRGPRSEVRGQRSEGRDRRSEVREGNVIGGKGR